MKLENLTPYKENDGSKAHLRVRCCTCGNQLEWWRASDAGWKYDHEGLSFRAYYCNECVSEMNKDRPEDHAEDFKHGEQGCD